METLQNIGAISKLEGLKRSSPEYKDMDDEFILQTRYNQYYKDKVSFDHYKSEMTKVQTMEESQQDALFMQGIIESTTADDIVEYLDVKQSEEIKAKGDFTYWEDLKKNKIRDFVPFSEFLPGRETQKNIELIYKKTLEGAELSASEQEAYDKFITETKEEELRGHKKFGNVLGNLDDIVRVPAEWYLTYALASTVVGTPAVGALTTAKLAKTATTATKIGQVALKTAKGLETAAVTTAAMTAIRTPTTVYNNYQSRKLAGLIDITDKGEMFFKDLGTGNKFQPKTLLKAYGDAYISDFTEHLGGVIFEPFLNATMPFLKTASRKVFGESLDRTLSKLGWNGFISEIGEEWIEKPLRFVAGLEDGQDYTLENFLNSTKMSADELMETIGAITLQGGITRTQAKFINYLTSRGVKREDAVKSAFSSTENELDTIKEQARIQETDIDKKAYEEFRNQQIEKSIGGNITREQAEKVFETFDLMYLNLGMKSGKSRIELARQFAFDITRDAELKDIKGQIEFEGNQAVINLFEKSDVSTMIHELNGHYFMNTLEALSDGNKILTEDLNTIKSFVGNKGEPFTTKQKELFARTAETYFRTGIAPNAEMKTTFEKLKDWLVDIYSDIKSLGTNLSKEAKDFFDSYIIDTVDISEDAQSLEKEINKEREVLFQQGLTEEEVEKIINDKYGDRLKKFETEFKKSIPVKMEDYSSNFTLQSSNNSISNIFLNKVSDFGKTVKEISTDIFTNADSILKNNYPEVWGKVMKTQAYIDIITSDYFKRIESWYKKTLDMKKQNQEDYYNLDFALKNRDIEKIKEITEKYNLYDDYINVRQILDELRDKSIETGIEVGYLENYFPRQIQQNKLNDFLNILRQNDSGIYNDLLYNMDILRKDGMFPTKEDELKYINSFLNGYTPKMMAGTVSSNLKKPREIEIITPIYNSFYEESNKALESYISNVSKNIILRESIGKESIEISNLRNSLKRKSKQLITVKNTEAGKIKKNEIIKLETRKKVLEVNLENLEKIKNPNEEITNKITEIKKTIDSISKSLEFNKKIKADVSKKNRINEINKEIEEIKSKLPNESILEDSIGRYISNIENLDINQQRQLKELLTYIFNPVASGKLNQILTNSSYALALNSIRNAINQLPELANSMYKNGFYNTINSIVGNKFTVKDLGIDIEDMFQDSFSLTKNIMKITGFSTLDTFSKNVFINANLKKSQELIRSNNKEFDERLYLIFGKETEQVKQDILKENLTTDVRSALLINLAEIQPIFKSSRPLQFLKNPSTRFIYSLKTFTLKQLDVIKNDILKKFKSDPKTAFKNLLTYQAFLMLIGFPIDFIQGIFAGEEPDDPELMKDSILDNLMLFNLISRYTIKKGSQFGYGKATTDYLFSLPVIGAVDDITKDMEKIINGTFEIEKSKSLKYIPFGKDIKNIIKED